MLIAFSTIFLASLGVVCYASYLVISHIIDQGTHFPDGVTLMPASRGSLPHLHLSASLGDRYRHALCLLPGTLWSPVPEGHVYRFRDQKYNGTAGSPPVGGR